jgi:hypothetical protein
MSKVVVLVKDAVRNEAPTAYLAEREEAERFEQTVYEDRPDLAVTIVYELADKLPELEAQAV